VVSSGLVGKHDKIAAQFTAAGGSPHHPCYIEYFRLFNAGRYYEAHDVLEHIWLGSDGETYAFYKALIQFAGGFVHLQHQHREPQHRIHGRRLRPAARLFRRSAELLASFPAHHEGADVAAVRRMALDLAACLEASGYDSNPWSPEKAPRLTLPL
jgi:predicted metal-dependent hydrolase